VSAGACPGQRRWSRLGQAAAAGSAGGGRLGWSGRGSLERGSADLGGNGSPPVKVAPLFVIISEEDKL